MKFLPMASRAERDATLEFRYHPKIKNPKTHMHTIHTWTNDVQTRCMCGKYDRTNPKLKQVTRDELPSVFGLLCKRCTWSDPGITKRLNP